MELRVLQQFFSRGYLGNFSGWTRVPTSTRRTAGRGRSHYRIFYDFIEPRHPFGSYVGCAFVSARRRNGSHGGRVAHPRTYLDIRVAPKSKSYLLPNAKWHLAADAFIVFSSGCGGSLGRHDFRDFPIFLSRNPYISDFGREHLFS